MASEHLINTIKQQATRLQQGLDFFQITSKRTQALEFISRHIYGYRSWNNVTGNSEDREFDSTFTGLHRQVAALCKALPVLSYGLEDLRFDAGTPEIMTSNKFRKGAIGIASIFSSGDPHILMWEELICDRYITEDMLSAYPPGMRPKTHYEACAMFKMQIEHRDRSDMNWTYGNFPWDKWQKIMVKAGIVDTSLVQGARDAYRECYQHGWDDELKLFCGYFDGGEQLSKLVENYPEEMRNVITYLMEHDGGHYDPQSDT